MKITRQRIQEIIREELARVVEEAPPGREDQVKALKGKVDNPYAVAWSQHNKHGKPQNELDEDDNEEPFSTWSDDQAKKTWQGMGNDFEKVRSAAEAFTDDPDSYAAKLHKRVTGKWPREN